MLLDIRIPTAKWFRFPNHRFDHYLNGLLAFALFGALGSSNPANAGFSVEISVNGGAPTVCLDNAAQDLNPAVGDIEIDLMVGDAFNNWRANGKVLATGGTGTPPVSTIVTDTLIEKLSAGLLNGQIEVKHIYAASGIWMHDAMIDGQFENTLGNSIGYADLSYTAKVNTFLVGSTYEGPATGVPGPVPFSAILGPLELPTTTEHIHTLNFYLDSPGDAIRLFNSAEIRTFVPEPATLALAGMCLSMVMFKSITRNRRDSGTMKK